jgi:hypothetical protein
MSDLPLSSLNIPIRVGNYAAPLEHEIAIMFEHMIPYRYSLIQIQASIDELWLSDVREA